MHGDVIRASVRFTHAGAKLPDPTKKAAHVISGQIHMHCTCIYAISADAFSVHMATDAASDTNANSISISKTKEQRDR